MLTLQQLRYLVAVSETGSLRQSAELLGVSSPALSKALRQLEGEAGAVLLRPDGRGIRLTAEGRELAIRARRVLEEVEQLQQAMDGRPPAQRLLRLGSFEVFTTYFLGELVQRYLVDVPVTVVSCIPGEVEPAVAQGAVDVGLTYAPTPLAGVEHVRCGTMGMRTWARAGSPWIQQRARELAYAAPVHSVPGTTARTRSSDAWPDDLAARRVLHRVRAMESALELCRRGVAVAYLPDFVVRLHNEQVLPAFRLEPVRHQPAGSVRRVPIFLACEPERREDPLLLRLVTAVSDVATPD